MRIARALAATVALCACRPPQDPARLPADLAGVRIRVAQLEAARGGGLAELSELAGRGPVAERALAIRGLGRVGGPRARAQLVQLTGDADAAIRVAAAQAIGVLASLDEPAPAIQAEFTRALLAALERASDAERPPIIEAIGRAADASAQLRLGELVRERGPAAVRSAAAYAFGRYGRRKIEFEPSMRFTLIEALADPVTTAGAAYAFAREHGPTGKPPLALTAAHQRLSQPLAAAMDAPAAETRALAAMAIAKQDVVGGAHDALERGLLDSDWRVAVECVRALGGERGSDETRDKVATALLARYAELERGKPTEAHVVIEALRVLAPYSQRALVANAITSVARSAAASTAASVQGITYGWIECLSLAALARNHDGDLAAVQGCKLPDHLRLPLVAELIVHQAGPREQRRELFAALSTHTDVRVRAATFAALASLYTDAPAAERTALVGVLLAALAAREPIIAGSAVDAAPAILAAIGAGDRAAIDAAIVARATTETDVELAAALLSLIGEQKLATGAGACRAASGKHPVLAAAGASCLRTLGEAPPPEREPAAATPPPVELARAFTTRRRWTLETTRGAFTIELAPDTAPWAVASIIALADKGFYDKLELHRVVPDFVVQGGDPTQSGWGGPGYVLPAEPASAGFVTGGVGMADAGRDSAGSQWFVMHGPAPHLDARYTFVGRVVANQAVADALLVGDTVTKTRVE